MKNRKVFSSLLNEGNKTFLKNKKTSNTISIDKLVPILNDNLSISNLKKIKVTNNFVDVDVNEYLIENYENRINGQSQKIISNFAQFSNTKVDRHRKLTLRSLWKQYKTENIEFLELLNDVIFNVEVDWNDKFNYSCGFNLFNTKLTHKAVEVKKNNSIVIEKPLEVKINKDVNWNDNLIKSIINEEEKEKISNKKQIDELKKTSSIEISQLIKKY
ncbi:MAG: hypothetical protein K2N40_00900, partial [Ureaplasma sp.]|nr:hypothetical protein [Ureaplasma sp.]